MSTEEIEIEHSKLNMASYGWGKALNEVFAMAFGAFGFFYYVSEIGLDVWLTGIGYIIFAIWNAINDPLVGFLTNRPFRFTRKWGRRFPWIVIGGIPWIFSYILIYTPPSVDPQSGALLIFAWLVFATCLYDTFNSIWWIGFASLFPDKFRSLKERRTVQAIATPIGIIGITLGALFPPLFIVYGDLQTYIIQGGVMILIGIVVFAASIPGCREDQIIVDRYLVTHKDVTERPSFFGMLKVALRQKSFLVFIIAYTFYRALALSVQGSVPFVVRYVLEMPAIIQTILSAGFLIGALVSSPLWIQLAHRTNNNKKVILISGFLLAIFSLPFVFIENVALMFIGFIFWGIGLGGFWALLAPLLADVIDESVVMTGKREEGIYNGFQAFFGRLAYILQVVSFATVQSLTGFVEGAETQSPLAVWGIHIFFGLIPMIFMLIAVIVLWRWYPLTPEKARINQEKVKEMGL
jgi:GPH family glycoside/pentoside/hexuronide:cation symporter